MDEKEIQRQALVKDQERIKQVYSKLYEERGKEMTERAREAIKGTPDYKKARAKHLGVGAVLGIPAGALISSKNRIAGGAAGAALGATSAYMKLRHKLHKASKSAVQNSLIRSLDKESKRNVDIHSYLAQPGYQMVTVKRPWGVETYGG